MTLIYIGFGLMTVAAAVLFAANKRLIKSLRKASDSLKETNEKLKAACKQNEDLRNFKDEYLDSIYNPTTVVEGQGQFSVYRGCESGRILAANYFFNPSDPNDREYIRIHTEEVAEKLNEKTMKFNGFEYNEYGVCTNPEAPYQFGKWNQYHFKIEVSETPRGWIYGYEWSHLTGGGGGGCFLNVRTAYPTKSKAVVAAAEFIKSCYKGDAKAKKAVAELDRIISEESKHRPTLKQYSIFDYL